MNNKFLQSEKVQYSEMFIEILAFIFAIVFFDSRLMDYVAGIALITYIILIIDMVFKINYSNDVLLRYKIKIPVASSVVLASTYIYPGYGLIYLPIIVFLMIVFFNIIIGRNKALEIILYIYAFINLIIVALKLDFTDNHAWIVIAQYFILALLSLMLSRIHMNKYSMDWYTLQSEKYKIDVINSATRLFRHDMKYILESLTEVQKYIKQTNYELADELCEEIYINGFDRINSLEKTYKTPSNLKKVLNKSIELYKEINNIIHSVINIDIPSDVNVMVNDSYLISSLNNILKNSRDAYIKKGYNDSLVINIYYDQINHALVISDNAGGFDIKSLNNDINNIDYTKNGVFIKSFMHDAPLMGITPVFKSIHDGTEVTMYFDRDDSPKISYKLKR